MTIAFNPTPAQIRTAENCCLMFEYENRIRLIVETYEREILARYQWKSTPVVGVPDMVILEPKDVYFLSEGDFSIFKAECAAAAQARRLPIEAPGQCPLSIAETTRRKAETLLIHALGEIPGFEAFKDVRYIREEQRAHPLELAKALFAPDVHTFEELIKLEGNSF
jgi:hypothetical protein